MLKQILQPFKSFYSKNTYRETGLKRDNTGLLYLFVLIAFCWSLQSLKMIPGISLFKKEMAQDILPQIPDMIINNGAVHLQIAQPHYIRSLKTNQIYAIIDTTGIFSACTPNAAPFILTKTQLLYSKDSIETRIIKINKDFSLEINQNKLHTWLNWITIATIPFIFVFMTVFAFIGRTILVLFYSLIGIIIIKFVKVSLPFKSLIRLSILAITPSILIQTVLDLANIKPPHLKIVFFLITVSYLVYGILSCKNQE